MRRELLAAEELEAGQMRRVQVGGRAIVVIRTHDGEFHALRDRCPHFGAPLSRGWVQREMVGLGGPGRFELAPDRFVVRCPWHGFEFDVADGRCPADPEEVRVKRYEVEVKDGKVFAEV